MKLLKLLFISIIMSLGLYSDDDINISKISAEIGFDNKSFSDDRYKDDRYYIQSVVPLKNKFTLVGLMEKINRFNQTDYNLHGELYKAFENKRWGYISSSYSPDASFLPIYNMGIYGYQGVGSFEIGMGYEFSHYKTQNINMFIPEYSYYINDKYYLTQKLYLVPQNGSWALSNQFHYDNLSNVKLYVDYTYSSSKEQINDIYTWSKINQNSVGINIEYAINSNYTLGLGYELSKAISNANSFNGKKANIFLRHYL